MTPMNHRSYSTLGRRGFLASAAMLTTAALARARTREEDATELQIDTAETEVLVVGGGTAGAIAAIQAAQAGAKTMLIEAGGQLGGTTTTGGVDYPGLFHAWGRQVIGGIGWELVRAAVELDTGVLPDFSKTPRKHSEHQVRVNGPLYAALLEEALIKAGGQLSFHVMPRAIRATEHGYELNVTNKESEIRIRCRQLIDCTGDANIVGRLGHERLKEKEAQPSTLMYALGDYDPKTLDANLIQDRYLAAVKEGRLLPGDVANPDGMEHARFIEFLRGRGSNRMHIKGIDASTSEGKTQANIAGRASVLRMLRFVRTLPGCEKARLIRMMTETGIRESWRIVGETKVTEADYVSGKVFTDAVCHSFYPIDLHTDHGTEIRPLDEGVVPTIPLGALIPKGSRHLLIAGRSVSSDRAANSALRVQASCMAMGQAAGAAAALAVRDRIQPRQVPIAELRRVLKAYGAIVPGS